ncbi:insulinase family protein [Paenibacillus arenosi]|uniref:Insulinase family protein n=1 Tax=Paenibacillus arenosi TaxID=2774142 RepID=A0ABR9AS26_9BACL|nr:insulinase family protein [Paenibacillus arenosi]
MNKTVLSNGMTIITNKVSSKIVALEYVVQVGAFHEEGYPFGISHFLEHMMLNGTTSRSKEDIFNTIQYLGGDIDANTSFYSTNYQCTIMKKFWKDGLEMVSDIVWNAAVPEGEIEKERKVIEQEIKMLSDDPINHLQEGIFANLFKDNPEKYTVIGTVDSISGINKTRLDAYRAQFYTPDRVALVVSGDIEHSEIVSFFDNYDIQASSKHIEELLPEAVNTLGSETYAIRSDFDQGYFSCAMIAPSRQSEDYYAFQLIINLLSEGLSSRLYRKLREELGLLYGLGMQYLELKDNGLGLFIAITAAENFAEVKANFIEELNKLKEQLISDYELQQIKNVATYHLYSVSESMADLNEKIVTDHMFAEIEDIEDTIQTISSITANDIMNCANRYFVKSNYMFVEMIPE